MENANPIRIMDGHLFPVPSVHYRVPFAEWVNKICSENRIDAIAVELGPIATKNIANILLEEKVGPNISIELPLMLGVIKINNRIHSKYKEEAVRLQKQYHKPLSQIPPEILRKDLGYSAYSLIPITPSDSIIEAIRCSLELNIPLYGIDLENFSHSPQEKMLIQDPILAQESLTNYTEQNELYADKCRDLKIDPHREMVMAARLRTLVSRHRRVLFVCGLAHWHNLNNLLSDPASISIAPNVISVKDTNLTDFDDKYIKVLLHPLIAAQYMDILPISTASYNMNRVPVNVQRTNLKVGNYKENFYKLINDTFNKYFEASFNLTKDDIELSMVESLLNKLNNHSVPVINYFWDKIIHESTKSILSEYFTEKINIRNVEQVGQEPDNNKEEIDSEILALFKSELAKESESFININDSELLEFIKEMTKEVVDSEDLNKEIITIPEKVIDAIVEDFNNAINNAKCIYPIEHFLQIKYSDKVVKLSKKVYKHKNFEYLNRLLLEEVFDEIKKFDRHSDQLNNKLADFNLMDEFQHYLFSLCLMNQREVPDLAICIKAAQNMMSASFIEALTKNLMDISPSKWQKPKDWSDTPVLCPAPISDSERPYIQFGEKVEVRIPKKSKTGNDDDNYDRSIPFYIDPIKNNNEYSEYPKIKWKWENDIPPPPAMDGENGEDPFTDNFIWPPCEYLFFATAYEAEKIARNNAPTKKTELFEGTLYDGVDIKTTLRSMIKQENRIYVKEKIFRGKNKYSEQPDLQPIVFVFSTKSLSSINDYYSLNAGFHYNYDPSFREYFSKKGQLIYDKKVFGSWQTDFISSIHVGHVKEVPSYMKPYVESLKEIQGSVAFGNPCLNFKQSAAWLEKGNFESNPIINNLNTGIVGITEFYREKHKIIIDLNDWQTALILYAIPYATFTKRIVIVAPDYFAASAKAQFEARKRNVQIDYVPLSFFSAERINEMRNQYSVKTTHGGIEYHPELDRIMGKSKDSHIELLPKEILNQAKLD